jgi:hypothetical protein
VEDLRRAVGPGFSLYTDIAQDLSDFVADPEDLYFVLLNLCRNARIADEVLRNNDANDDDACIETGRRKQYRPIQFNCNILGPWEDGSECD